MTPSKTLELLEKVRLGDEQALIILIHLIKFSFLLMLYLLLWVKLNVISVMMERLRYHVL